MPEPRSNPRAAAGGERWVLALLLAVALLAPAFYWGSEIYLLSGRSGFPLDDAWIHLQFARNLAAGEGLTYNPGEIVAGSTAPLWTALVSILLLLPGNPVIWVKLAGIALYLATGHATFVLGRRLGMAAGAAGLAAVLTLGTSWLVWSALSGLEILLFAWLSLWGVCAHLTERRHPGAPPLSLTILGLACLARPEGFLLLFLAVADRLSAVRRDGDGLLVWRPALGRSLWIGAGIATAVVVPMLLFNLWSVGSFLPTTFSAKASGFHRFAPDLRYIYRISGIFFEPQPLLYLTAAAGALRLGERLGSKEDRGLLPALWLVGLPLAYSTLRPSGAELLAGNFGRYFFPLFPFLALMGVLGIERLGESIGRVVRVGPLRVPVRALLLVLILAPTLIGLSRGAGRYVRAVVNVEDSDVRMAKWLSQRLPAEAVLAVNDIGALKYFLPNRVLDLAGILHPEVPRMIREAQLRGDDGHRGVLRFLEENRPDYLVIFPDWYPALIAPGSPFEPVHAVRIEDNMAMGGDELVVYSTPWNRHPLGQAEER